MGNYVHALILYTTGIFNNNLPKCFCEMIKFMLLYYFKTIRNDYKIKTAYSLLRDQEYYFSGFTKSRVVPLSHSGKFLDIT